MQTEELFKAFADRSRVKIISSLMTGPKFVEQLSQELNIGASTVSFHLKKLQAAGVVSTKKEQYYQVYFIDKELMNKSFSEVLSCNETPATDDAFYKSVLDEWFIGGRAEKLPVQIKKREVIYREILKKLKKGKSYTHGEISVMIADSVEDFMTAKKEMFSLGLLKEVGGKVVLSEGGG